MCLRTRTNRLAHNKQKKPLFPETWEQEAFCFRVHCFFESEMRSKEQHKKPQKEKPLSSGLPGQKR
jgi:hypothetical protein